MIRKVSAKKLASLGGKLPFSTISSAPKKPAKRAKPMNKVNRIRRATAFARAYHSHERVAFVRSLACAACGVVGYSENAHVLGNGGMSRKAGYETIAPLCGIQPVAWRTWARWAIGGCHTIYDESRQRTPLWLRSVSLIQAVTKLMLLAPEKL